ncbi:MAG: 4-hydroxy-tetrahydrodipicolinate reductase [Paludibacter sp.]|nr:4-hydroxy-tetrahydrodipicolinate reductase [Bacteroidales bacterium]MCM1069927.1 4-hydroxy-tetrahydrodipicolinate reductase [Prevotella sp.]MCM1354656.1 4-hydroxy-tetrahydrodipicolinate reductase [Bacteroides sp.]MCM1443503.1 4-hydroxy-tetrahydrodipicolinate reductase [Muribaculum sp.]MCM1482609.1 4-hydroxy-tetrahydrodipicolinate reductase [Paludibacter sp.]
MRIALIGYGKMGRMIEQIALQRGHEIVCVVDKDNAADINSDAFRSADVAIEFTTPLTAESNIRKAWENGVPIVSGTTGWTERLPLLKEELQTNGQALFWTSNYSVGVNVFFALNRYLAQLMAKFPEYDVSLEETHHIHKLDAPSGTAVSLAEDVVSLLPNKTGWRLQGADLQEKHDQLVPIVSIREGEVPGTHVVTYESTVDTLTISHAAKSREGFAKGAVFASEFLVGKQGFYDMNDLLHLNI